jgi:hypothetical protein
MWLELRSRCRGAKRTFLGLVYLPPSALDTAAGVASAFSQLLADVQRFQQLGEVVLMGDFNSRVGAATHPGERVGQWGEPGMPDVGGRALLTFLASTDLYALNGRRANPDPQRHVPEYTRVRSLQTNAGVQEQAAVLDYVLAPRHLAVSPDGAAAGVCQLRVEPRWRPTSADHMLMWFCVPHESPQQCPPAHVRCRPNVHLLTRPSDMQRHHREAYSEAVEAAMAGYTDALQQLHQAVSEGRVTAADAAAEAKQQFCTRVHAAVHASIGYKETGGKHRVGPQPVFNRAVRAAVQAKRAAVDGVVAATHAAAADPARFTELQGAQQALRAAHVAVRTAVKEARAVIETRQVGAVHECASKHDSKGMWRALKRLGGGAVQPSAGPTALVGPDGTLVMGDQQVADALAAQFQTATDSVRYAQGAGFDEQHQASVEEEVQAHRQHTSYANEGPEWLSAPIASWEVTVQCQRMQNWKAPSPIDGIHNELLKCGGDSMLSALTALLDVQFQLETKAQTAGVIKALHKRDDPTVAGNYRPITLGSAVDKLYNAVLNARLSMHLEDNALLHESQHGFRPRRSAVDNIYMLNQCLAARMHARLDTYLMFLDIEKAYDSVWRAGLLWHVWHKGIQGKLFRVLAQMTDNPTSMVLHNGAFSAAFQPDMGWEQGDTLATTMFNIHVDAVLQDVWQQHEGVPMPGNAADQPLAKLTALMYADDMCGLAASHASLQQLIDATRAALQKWRLKASVKPTDGSKTAIMVVRGGSRASRVRVAGAGPAQHGEWRWGQTPIPQVRHYRYLGALLSDAGVWGDHMEHRFQKANAAVRVNNAVLKNSRLPWHVRKLTLVAAVQPVLTYACQVWNCCTHALRRKLDGWQGAVLRSVTHCPPTASAKCLRQELGVLPLHMSCDLWQLTYWHKLRTLNTDRLLHQVHTAWSGASNPWMQNIHKLLAEYAIDEEATMQLSKGKFVKLVRQSILAGMAEVGQREGDGAVLESYIHHFGAGVVRHDKPAPRAYIHALGEQGRAPAAELCMRLRVEALQLRAVHSHQRRNETAEARRLREACPCCHQAAETTHHFLLECPAYAEHRAEMLEVLRTTHQHRHEAILAASPTTAWRLLLSSVVLDGARHSWRRQQRQGQRLDQQQPLEEMQPLEEQHLLLDLQQPLDRSLDQQQQQADELAGAVADYVMAAWKVRNAALNGRGANGGDAMA